MYKVRIGAERDPFVMTLYDDGALADLTGHTDSRIDFWSNGLKVLSVSQGDTGVTVTNGAVVEQVEYKWQAGDTEKFSESERAYAVFWVENSDGWKAYPEDGAAEFRVTRDGP